MRTSPPDAATSTDSLLRDAASFRYHLPATFDSYPALAGDGPLLVGDDDGELLAFGS
jgi:hypothetical protein